MIKNSLSRLFRAEVRLPGQRIHRSFSPSALRSLFLPLSFLSVFLLSLPLANNYQKSLGDEFFLLFFKSLVTTTPFGTAMIRREDDGSLEHLNNRAMLIFAFLILGTYCQSFLLPAQLSWRAAFRLPFATIPPTGRTSTTIHFSACPLFPHPSGKQTEKATRENKRENIKKSKGRTVCSD